MQIDELDLAWEDEAQRGRPRHRRSSNRGSNKKAKQKKGRGGRTVLALLLVFAVLGGLAGGVWWGADRIQGFLSAPDYNAGGTGEVTVEVKEGDFAADIGETLESKDVVKSSKAFVQAADRNPKSKTIQPGKYKLRSKMRATDALSMLLDLKNKIVSRVTVREGLSYKATFNELSKATKIPVSEFEAAAQDPVALGVPDFWFNRRDNKPAKKSIEGFLYPQTYEFDPDVTASGMLKEMVQYFLKVTTSLGFVNTVQSTLSVSPYEALTVASLAQAEAGIEEDLPKVARVAYNRAYKRNMPLQFDVTANYWLELQGKDPKHSGKLTPQELNDPNNPYNTVSKIGLPLGPIDSPGEKALAGAMNPADGNWIFFVAVDKTGRSAFAETDADHQRNIQIACQNGIPLC